MIGSTEYNARVTIKEITNIIIVKLLFGTILHRRNLTHSYTGYKHSKPTKSRVLRSLLHGFISLNFLGYFQNPVSSEDSFQLMIDDFILSVSRNY
ncbi:TetR-like C-terminal domain-containing protein [Clostridium sp. JNZ X4-2]